MRTPTRLSWGRVPVCVWAQTPSNQRFPLLWRVTVSKPSHVFQHVTSVAAVFPLRGSAGGRLSGAVQALSAQLTRVQAASLPEKGEVVFKRALCCFC